LIERNEIYPRNSNNITRTAKQHDTLLESFFARLKDDPILDEKADESGILDNILILIQIFCYMRKI
ncbi:hypothetical protein WUBG_13336, partial [Wuchereria bancrofti]